MQQESFSINEGLRSQEGRLTNGAGFFTPFSSALHNRPSSSSVSLTPSSVDEAEKAISASETENRLYLAKLTLQYQEMIDRYDLCVAHLQDMAVEAESLRRKNAELRLSNAELARRLSLLSIASMQQQQHQQQMQAARSSYAAGIANDLKRLYVGDGVLLGELPARVVERKPDRVTLPKSISIRSSGFVKMDRAGVRNGRLRVTSPLRELSQKAYEQAGEGDSTFSSTTATAGENTPPLELEVYNQGTNKTELCNKWQETGSCPYGPRCQFAHGIAELRPVIRHPRYKTEICRMVLHGLRCPYGHRCHFRHSTTTTTPPTIHY
ncbi:Zinc finger CCCH domain-containing protein 9 [Acorus calamus]|uniref:Zinc finger CCCH domain-containing protein 9 n=1 Tax=Acorus calamus TaxID=4465 RepID=A0AAV9DKM0_ACOCL|nr:Zinc finger CCCH domain-containing protein 9 [Acorus calamus]